MTNSLTLKQCHFVGQSSILFSKYIYESFQGLYNQTGYVFYPSFVVVILMGNRTTGLRPGMRTAAPPLAIDWRRRHAPLII